MALRIVCMIAFLLAVPVIFTYAQEELKEAPAAADTQQQQRPLKIAVVDIQQLLTQSEAAESIQEAGRDIRDGYMEEIKEIESGLKEKEADILKNKENMSEEEFVKQRQAFQKELLEGQNKVRELNKKLDKGVGEALNTVRDTIVGIVSEMAAEEGYDLVISRDEVVIVSKKIDITAAVMEALNDKLSKVKVKG